MWETNSSLEGCAVPECVLLVTLTSAVRKPDQVPVRTRSQPSLPTLPSVKKWDVKGLPGAATMLTYRISLG